MNTYALRETEPAYRTGVMPGRQQATPWPGPYRPSAMMQSWVEAAGLLQQAYQTMTQPLMGDLDQMYTSLLGPWARAMQPSRTGSQCHCRKCEGGCEHGLHDCDHDRCACRCCICDADLVVYARPGERRLVPIAIDNVRQRDRQIRLELSTFSGQQGASQVSASILGEQEFTLRACDEHITILAIEGGSVGQEPGESATQERPIETGRGECEVVYGDLRIEGCDIRPVRIAVALLPFGCDAHEVRCDCCCC